MKTIYLSAIFCCLLISSAFSQDPDLIQDNFVLTGDAISKGENCFRLTPAKIWKGGTIWYKDALDLRHPLEMNLEMSFGCSDEGADGIVFILHSQLLTGEEGEGMGFGGLSPSFGMEMDTYQNFHLQDPHYDHIAFIKNGSVNHEHGVGKPTPIFSDKRNIEDCTTHEIQVTWNPDFNNMRFHIDGVLRLNINYEVINNIFNGNPNVFWGFAAATGGMYNEHKICIKDVRYEQASQLDLLTISEILDGQRTILDNIVFDEKNQLNEASVEELNKLSTLLQTYPKHIISISAYTDNALNPKAGFTLTEQQAKIIKDYLIERGINDKRIRTVGYGQDHPIAPNDTPEGRKKNRRIEVAMSKPRV